MAVNLLQKQPAREPGRRFEKGGSGNPAGRRPGARNKATLADFAALNVRSKFWGDDGRAGFKNWEEVTDPRNPLGGRQGVDERIMLRELLRRLDMMVILENRLDALVRLHTPLPPAKIGGANDPLGGRNNLRPESFYGPNAGLTEVLIPAGYVTGLSRPAGIDPKRTSRRGRE